MEKKTLGSFVAALRKAEGLTQKELAEKLNVSDKSISRWERDESSPDLSLIPVLAELFGVTSDELLRGERRPQSAPGQEESAPSQKGEKQRRRLLAASLTRYKNRSLLSAALAICGLLAALVGNFALLRAAPGFFVGLLFFLAAAVLQGVWVNAAWLTLSDEELMQAAEAADFRRRVVRSAARVWALTACLLTATLPPMLNLLDPARTGLDGDSYLPCALFLAGITLLLALLLWGLLQPLLVRHGLLTQSPGEAARYRANRTLLVKCALGLALTAVLTFALQVLSLKGWDLGSLAEGTEFHDYDSFVAFIEQDTPTYWTISPKGKRVPSDFESGRTLSHFDTSGDPVYEDPSPAQELTDRQDNLLCSFYFRNPQVALLSYGPEENGYLPIKAISQEQYQAALAKGNQLTAVFAVVYTLECTAAVVLYLRKREK